MGALGDRVIEQRKLASPVHPDIAIRWSDIVMMGISEDEKNKLLEKYPPPENCVSIDPAISNNEIKSKKEDQVINRDKRIESKQKKNTAALAAISKGLSLLIMQEEVLEKFLAGKDEDNPDFELLTGLKKEKLETIECFSNAGRLMTRFTSG